MSSSSSQAQVSECFLSKLQLKPARSNTSCLWSVFEKPLVSLQLFFGVVWTVGLTVQIKLSFSNFILLNLDKLLTC